jgi:hypothetical protein
MAGNAATVNHNHHLKNNIQGQRPTLSKMPKLCLLYIPWHLQPRHTMVRFLIFLLVDYTEENGQLHGI